MKKIFLAMKLVFCLCVISRGQTNRPITIKGKVISSFQSEPLANATVRLKENNEGTITDSSGNFLLKVVSLPVTLEISFAEFQDRTVQVYGTNEQLIILESVSGILNPVTLVGTRTQTRSLNAPVTLEYIGKTDMINTPAESYWSGMLFKKGLDVTTSSLTYKTYSTRGFNGSGSSRVNQLMDA